MKKDQKQYFMLRAEAERRLAEQADSIEAQHAHKALAERYRQLCGEPGELEPSGR